MYSCEDFERLFIRYKGEAIRVARVSKRSAIQGNSREGCAHPVGLAYKQWASFASGELKLRGVEVPRGEGGSMLSVSGPETGALGEYAPSCA